MPLYGLSMHRQITETATAAGLAPTDDQIERVNLIAQALGEQADDGRAVIDGLDPISFISRELAAMPVAKHVHVCPPGSDAEASRDEQAGVLRLGNSVQVGRHDAFAQAIRATQRAERAAAADDAAAYGNPWATHSWNRTNQAVLTNLDPERASQMRAAAEAAPQ